MDESHHPYRWTSLAYVSLSMKRHGSSGNSPSSQISHLCLYPWTATALYLYLSPQHQWSLDGHQLQTITHISKIPTKFGKHFSVSGDKDMITPHPKAKFHLHRQRDLQPPTNQNRNKTLIRPRHPQHRDEVTHRLEDLRNQPCRGTFHTCTHLLTPESFPNAPISADQGATDIEHRPCFEDSSKIPREHAFFTSSFEANGIG